MQCNGRKAVILTRREKGNCKKRTVCLEVRDWRLEISNNRTAKKKEQLAH